ncbi:MAG TPA: XdhC family protein [Nocardioidaceae bacterium]|nr:XdhC family protein [Nocardioidaceae bacterium]
MTGHAVDGWEMLERASEMSRRGEDFALATVVWRQGPSSGQTGSRAIITSAGTVHGWIGGACAEPVVIREALQAMRERESRLLLLGTPDQFAGAVPDGMVVVPIACQSDGALEVFVEPVVPTVKLVVVGSSPMTQTLADLADALGWQPTVVDGAAFADLAVDPRAVVVVATQGHGDEEAMQHAVEAKPAFVGLVASRRRGEAVLGYLADRGVPADDLARVRCPVGLDLGPTSHREIAVAIVAEIVQRRAAGELIPHATPAATEPVLVLDPVCGMTVAADQSNHPIEIDGVTYYFCGVGCRDAFEREPSAFVNGPASKEV